VVLLASIPILAMLVSATLAVSIGVSAAARNVMNHFAAGLVFAIVAVELLPDIHEAQPWAVVVGFGVGVAAMLSVGWLGGRLEKRNEGNERSLIPLLVTVGVDLFIDGLLLGIAFSLGATQGVLLTVALTVEVLALGTTVTGKLLQRQASKAMAVGIPVGLSVLLTVGAVIGKTLLGGLEGAPFAMVVSFGIAALLYLVVEELLVEAHEEEEDTTLGVVSFFVGFLVLLLLSA
jgi:ZIP family zinc transporter